MNIYLIIYAKDLKNPEIFDDRIKSLGDYFRVFDNIIFVECDLNVKDIYDRISVNEFEKESILVLYVKNETFGYWGRMNVKLWDWLSEREEMVDGIDYDYIKDNHKLSTKNKTLEIKIKRLTQKIEELEKNE